MAADRNMAPAAKRRRIEDTPCVACEAKRSRYRCTGCPACYCSLPCFKIHKSSCPAGAEFAPKPIERRIREPSESGAAGAPNPQACFEERLRWLVRHKGVRSALRNKELQGIIRAIDGESGEAKAQRLEHFLENNADFAAFVQEMLAVLQGAAADARQ